MLSQKAHSNELPMISKISLPGIIKNNTSWLEKRQSSILSAATVIMAANVLSSISGLFRNRYIEQVYGGTSEVAKQTLDSFWLAFQVPDLLFQLIVLGALSAAFIPVFTSLKKKSEQQAFRMASIMMNIILAVVTLGGMLIFIFAEEITHWRTGDAITPQQLDITVNLTRLFILQPILMGLSNFLTGILQSYQKFIVSSLSPLFYNIGILLGVWAFADQWGIYGAGLGVIFGAFLHMIIQVGPVMNIGFRYKPEISLNSAGVQTVLRLMPPRMLSYGLMQMQHLANGFFITSLPSGGLRLLTYALTVVTIPIRWFGISISQASLPFLSDQSEPSDTARFQALLIQSLNQVAFFVLPSSVLLIILRIPVMRMVMNFSDWKDTLIAAKVVGIIAVSIYAHSMVHVFVRAFHAVKRTKLPLVITCIAVAVYLFSSWLLTFQFGFGLTGIAISNTISACIECVLLGYFVHTKIVPIAQKSFLITQIKISIASFLMAVFLYLPYRILDITIFETSRVIELLALTVVTTTIGMLVYVYFAYLLNVKELRFIQSIMQSVTGWRGNIAKTEEVIVETDNND